MNHLSFISIFLFLLNVSLTRSLSFINNINSPVNQNDLESSVAEKSCYDKFKPRVNYIIAEIKNNTHFCTNADDLKLQINEKVRLMHGLMAKCNLEQNPKKYFACVGSFAIDSKKISNEIVSITENISKINKTECALQIFERARYKSSSALYDLNLCLQTIYQSNLSKTPATSTPSGDSWDDEEEQKDFYTNALNKIRVEYAKLKKCFLDDPEEILKFEKCWQNVHIIPKYGFPFKKLTEIDNADNTCIRQFIIMASNEYFQFDLEGCLRHGYSSVIQSQESEEKDIQLINNIIKFHNSFDACRVISKDLNTFDCVIDLLNNDAAIEIQEEISIKSEGNFNKLREIIDDLYTKHLPCIGDILPRLQFDSMDMLYNESFVLQDCFLYGYKSTFPKNNNEVLTKLKIIQNNIKSCTLHPESPGLKICFENYVMNNVDLNYIGAVLTDPYYKLAVEYDKTMHTCFQIILDGCEDWNCEDLRNCIFKKS